MKNTKKIISEIESILKEGNIEEYKQEAKIIVKELSNLSTEDIVLLKQIENENEIIDFALKRAKTKEPLQYLLGYWYFMGEKYILDKNVLIPRDETEILVNCAYDLIKEKKGKLNILDIGVGSGIISCALAKKLEKIKDENDFEILGCDISLGAIKIALENVNRLNLVRKVILRKSDLLSKIRENEKFDLIVSNPPYIPKKEKKNLAAEVLKEPEIALFTNDEEGIENYEKIIKNSRKYLKKEGFIAFELGVNQYKKVYKILEENGFKNIKIQKDLANTQRVICAQII